MPIPQNIAIRLAWRRDCDPTAYLQSLEHVEMACHMHYPEDRDAIPSNLAHEHPCIGALQLCANAMMFPRAARPKDIPGMIYNKHLDSVQKNDEVFKWKHEFIKHHNHEV